MIKWIFLILGIFSMVANSESRNETVFINGKVYTGTNAAKAADAFIVKDGRFLKLGNTEEIRRLAGRETLTVDLKGARVLPGFIEAHAHLLGLGQSKLTLDLRGLQVADIVDLVIGQANKQSGGTWIKGRNWDQNLWPSKEFPNKNVFSRVKNPVYLRRVDGHAVWINDAALKLAQIDKDTPDPDGGQIIRDQDGQATGVLIDNAISLVSKHLDKPSRRDLELYLDLAMNQALSLGITSLHDAGVGADAIELYKDYAQKKQLKVRIYAMLDGDDEQLVNEYLKSGPINVDDLVTVRSIKYFADGALGSRGASLLDDYEDKPGHSGLMLISKANLSEKTQKALISGFQVATHAIGDRANRLVLDAYEDALKSTHAKDARLRIEHAQLIDPSDHHRFKELSVIASMQPIHCTADMAWVPEKIGDKRLKDRAYPWRSLLSLGVTLAFGSDAPVEDINPILGLYAAVTRSDASGSPDNGFMPEQKLKFKEALNGYFGAAAFAEFNDHQKGRIAEGFLADFVVFDDDILHPFKSSFLQARPVMTVVNGEIVYRR